MIALELCPSFFIRVILSVYIYIFFTNILRILDERHMTKQDLADRSGISISFLSDLTTGKANPSLKVMESIAAALDVSLPYLLESSDLDDEILSSISDKNFVRSLPLGYERISVVLSKQKAFIVKQWAEETKKELSQEGRQGH